MGVRKNIRDTRIIFWLCLAIFKIPAPARGSHIGIHCISIYTRISSQEACHETLNLWCKDFFYFSSSNTIEARVFVEMH